MAATNRPGDHSRMERMVNLDRAARQIARRRQGWAAAGLMVDAVTWRDEAAAWPQPLETSRSRVKDPDSLGVRITGAGGAELLIVLFRGGWADVDFMTRADVTVTEAPEVGSPEEFGALADSLVRRVFSDSADAEAEAEAELWRRLGHQFAEDDGSLPEVEVAGLSAEGMGRVYRALLAVAAPLGAKAEVWPVVGDGGIPLREVADPAAAAFSGELHAFRFLLTGVVFDSVEIPDLGVFVGEDITLDFRSGDGWDPVVLGAFIRLLASLRDLESGASIGFWRVAVAEEREKFADAVTVYLAHRRHLRR